MKKSRHYIVPLILMIYHMCFSYIAWSILIIKKGDAYNYWFVNKELSSYQWGDFLRPGTNIVKLITYPFAYFEMPFWSGFVLFSFISGLGVLLLWDLFMKISEGKKNTLIALFLILMPNLHFWTANIGKESLLFLPLIIILQQLYLKNFFSITTIIAFIIVALIRPHLAFVLISSFTISLFFTQFLTSKKKILILASAIFVIGILAILLFNIQDFSGGIPRILHKYNVHILYFKNTNAYVPLDSYSLPYKIFTFYFRPLPLENTGFLYTVAGIENMLLLLTGISSAYLAIKHMKKLKNRFVFVFSVTFLFLFAIMYVYAYANFGIILRTRMIASPFLYCCILEILSVSYLENIKIKIGSTNLSGD